MPTSDKARQLSRIKLRSDQLVEIHLDKLPEPPDQMLKLPGVGQWMSQMRLKEERDTQALHRMLTQLNGNIAAAAEPATVECTTLPGLQGEPGVDGEDGEDGQDGADGADGAGDGVLAWMNL